MYTCTRTSVVRELTLRVRASVLRNRDRKLPQRYTHGGYDTGNATARLNRMRVLSRLHPSAARSHLACNACTLLEFEHTRDPRLSYFTSSFSIFLAREPALVYEGSDVATRRRYFKPGRQITLSFAVHVYVICRGLRLLTFAFRFVIVSFAFLAKFPHIMYNV